MESTLDIGVLRERIVALGARRVAIDGRGGSGKSTLARALAGGWPGAVVVEMDDFHRPSRERVEGQLAYGADWDRERLIVEVLRPLALGRAARYRRYDWGEDRLAEWHEVPADAVLVLEGICSTSQPLRGFLDYAIVIDCPYDVRLRRGVERDGEGMRGTWVESWMPAEDRYFEAERPDERADFLLDGSCTDPGRVAYRILGPRDEPVALAPYDAGWPARFEQERELVLGAIAPWVTGGIHHVGSTSVPGLDAKPVIDILVGVESLAASRACLERLAPLGYRYAPYRPGEMHWLCKPGPRLRTHHLHLVPTGSGRYRDELAFRDALRADRAVALAYVDLKRELARENRLDRDAYTAGKGDFIARVLARARPSSGGGSST